MKTMLRSSSDLSVRAYLGKSEEGIKKIISQITPKRVHLFDPEGIRQVIALFD